MDDTDNPDLENAGSSEGAGDPPKPESNTLTHPKFEVLREAIQILYIRGNQSGRIYFNKEWPDVAAYILGHELIRIDTHGSDDKELRKDLEEEAEERQYGLLNIFETLEDNSAKSGVLQTDFVEGVVTSLGRELSLLVYTDKIVDRFAPAGAAPSPADDAGDKTQAQPSDSPVTPKEAASDLAPSIAPATETGENAQAQVPPASVEEAAQDVDADAKSEATDAPREPRSVSGVVVVEKPD
jgi:hypothetical protein